MKAPKRTQNVGANKASYMSDQAFADLKEALEDALAFECTEPSNLCVTRIEGAGKPKYEPERRYGRTRIA
jgi:hypothetical protein